MFWTAACWSLMFSVITFKANGFSEGTFSCRNHKTDLVVLLDGTITLGYKAFDQEREFVKSVLSELPIGPSNIQVGIIQFSDQYHTKIELQLGDHTGVDSVSAAMDKIQYFLGARTLTGMAMQMANEQFLSKGRTDANKVLFVITDGKPADMKQVKQEEQILNKNGVKIITMAIATRESVIQRHKYEVRSLATGFAYSFTSIHDRLPYFVKDVAKAICSLKLPSEPITSFEQKCFQEKKDIVFAMDGSSQVSETVFKKAMAFISKVSNSLDIAPSLIHVGFIQYSDKINTRIEFGLNRYMKYYQVNESLNNIAFTKGNEADLEKALNIIDEKIFTGENGDRISAGDFLLLFVNDEVKNKDGVLRAVEKLKQKGVHLMIIGLGKSDQDIAKYYEKLASHLGDVTHIDRVEVQNVVRDLTATTCKKVNCKQANEKEKKEEQEKKERECKQRPTDVLFMVDASRHMAIHFKRIQKFFTKIVKKLNIAATNTHVGFLQFSGNKVKTELKLGRLKFETDIIYRINRARRMRGPFMSNIASALGMVNRKVFNTSTGGHRKKASDLILIATRGKTYNRIAMQKEIKILKNRGVNLAVLDVGHKNRVRKYQNILHDLSSGPREVFPLDFKRLEPISKALLNVECRVLEQNVSKECFDNTRKVVFMLDSSAGMNKKQRFEVLKFVQDIVKKLYVKPQNIAVGLVQYSDMHTAQLELELKKRPLKETLRTIQSLIYRWEKGEKNFLGHAMKFVKKILRRSAPVKKLDVDEIVILITHSEPADPEKAYKHSEWLKSRGAELISVVLHMQKKTTDINQQYKALASSRASTYSIDFDKMMQHSTDIVLNLCELNTCPADSTKDCRPIKQDIFMMIDSSLSITMHIFEQLKTFVRRLVSKLDVSPTKTHVGVMQVSSVERTQYEMKLGEYEDPKIINIIISGMHYHEGKATFIGKGLEMAIADNLFNGTKREKQNNDRVDAENVLIIFTDGSFHDEHTAKKWIDNLKQRGVRVVMVGLGKKSRMPRERKMLESLASSNTDIHMINLQRDTLWVENELNEVVQHVATLECINIYEPPVECTPENLDLFVVVDGSRSVGWRNFIKIQTFLKKLANEFEIGPNKAHFGVMQYGNRKDSRIEFHLDNFTNNQEVNEAITKMTFLSSGKTETGHAFSVVNTKVFNGKGGDRPGVPNILILFTDGYAHDIQEAYHQANAMKNRGVRIIGIAAGKKGDKLLPQIRKMVSTNQDAHKAKFSELSGIVDDLLDVVCR